MRDDVILMGMSAEHTILRGNRKGAVVTGAHGASISHFTIEGGYNGIQCENTIMTIENCVIKGNRTGIHCVIALPLIRNNIVFRNRWSGIFCETTRTHRGSVSNNVIAENGYCGVMLAGQSQVLVENNIFYFNKQYGVFAAEGARRSRIVNNNFFGNRNSGNQYSAIDQTNQHYDPQYSAVSSNGFTFWNDGQGGAKNQGGGGRVIGPLKRTFYGGQPGQDGGTRKVNIEKSSKQTGSGKDKNIVPVCQEEAGSSGEFEQKRAKGGQEPFPAKLQRDEPEQSGLAAPLKAAQEAAKSGIAQTEEVDDAQTQDSSVNVETQ
jgi:parallel beta-helix repeat protein